jgi:hypothetical protein
MRFGDSERSWIGALIGGLVGGTAIATVWRFSPQKDFWDILAALGTVGAAVVALYLANRDTRRRDGDARNRAAVAAASLTLRLSMTYIDMKRLHDEMKDASVADCGPGSFLGWQQRIHSIEWFTQGEIDPLVPLGNGCAGGIAGAQDRLEVANRLLVQFVGGRTLYLSDERKVRADHVASIVGEALELLDRAAKECQKAALPVVWPRS